MTELELVERIKLEEDTLCCLPFESRYKTRRAELTQLANLHRAMLAGLVCSRDRSAGQGEADSDCQAAPPTRMRNWDNPRCAPHGSVGEGELDDVRVLVVESEPVVALLLRLVLENRGYSVRNVGGGAAAVAESGRWAPDVIVTELPIADAPTVQYIAQVRAQVVGGVLVIGTASNMPLVPGIDAVFARPFDAEVVARGVGVLLGEGMADRPCDPPLDVSSPAWTLRELSGDYVDLTTFSQTFDDDTVTAMTDMWARVIGPR